MNNPFISVRKHVIIAFSCMAVLSPAMLLFFPFNNFLVMLIYSILSGCVLFGLAQFFSFRFKLDISDAENISEENQAPFRAVLTKENKFRITFFYISIAAMLLAAIVAVVLQNMLILISGPVALLLIFMVFQNIIKMNDIPHMRKKLLEDNIDNNLSFISKKDPEDETSFEKEDEDD